MLTPQEKSDEKEAKKAETARKRAQKKADVDQKLSDAQGVLDAFAVADHEYEV
jgi:hypothetical protein